MRTWAKEFMVQLPGVHALMADRCGSGARELRNVVSIRDPIATQIAKGCMRVLVSKAEMIVVEIDLVKADALRFTTSIIKPSDMWSFTEQGMWTLEGILVNAVTHLIKGPFYRLVDNAVYIFSQCRNIDNLRIGKMSSTDMHHNGRIGVWPIVRSVNIR